MAFQGFTDAYFQFFGELTGNNERAWFQANKQRYEDHVVSPMLALIAELAPRLERISAQLVADPRRSGGSMFRIFRDTRFAKDKTPYKTHAAAQFRHASGQDVHAPGLYLHGGLDECVIGVGIWQPDPESLQKIRQHLVAHESRWCAIRDDAQLLRYWTHGGEALKRPPRGFDASSPIIEDLKRKDFICMHALSHDEFLSPDLPDLLATRYAAARGYLAFLCEALALPF